MLLGSMKECGNDLFSARLVDLVLGVCDLFTLNPLGFTSSFKNFHGINGARYSDSLQQISNEYQIELTVKLY